MNTGEPILPMSFFPLIDYRSENNAVKVDLLKGLISYGNDSAGKSLGFYGSHSGFIWERRAVLPKRSGMQGVRSERIPG